MAAPESFQLSLGPITGFAFSPDRQQVAISPNSNDAQIFTRGGPEGWELSETLAEHDKLITSISWAPNTNRIVTCSQDRNAYVWTPTPNAQGVMTWKPALVLLRINRAATSVHWSPNEDKFAVASGARTIAVCSFDEDNDWWVSKHIKKPLRSTVLGLEWHPNNVLLAAGAADSKAYVFSAVIKGVDSKPQPTVWGDGLKFGALCGEFSSPNGGWVHDVAFSPSGNILAFTSHDSSISVVYPSGPQIVIRSPSLPYVSLTFISESQLIAAGHDCQPVVFAGSDGGWALDHSLDDPAAAGAGAKPLTPSATGRVAGPGRLNTEAFNRFRQADSRGASSTSTGSSATKAPGAIATAPDGSLLTVHQNTITSVQPYEWSQNGDVSKVATAGRDGRLVIWNVEAAGLAGGVKNLRM